MSRIKRVWLSLKAKLSTQESNPPVYSLTYDRETGHFKSVRRL